MGSKKGLPGGFSLMVMKSSLSGYKAINTISLEHFKVFFWISFSRWHVFLIAFFEGWIWLTFIKRSLFRLKQKESNMGFIRILLASKFTVFSKPFRFFKVSYLTLYRYDALSTLFYHHLFLYLLSPSFTHSLASKLNRCRFSLIFPPIHWLTISYLLYSLIHFCAQFNKL